MCWFTYLFSSYYFWAPLVAVVAHRLTVTLTRWFRVNQSLPPGPCGLPIVGYLPFLKRPHDFQGEMTDLSRRYGPIFSLKLGSELLVFLCDHRLIRDAFHQPHVFDARPQNKFFKLVKGYGIVYAEGKLWKEQRRFLQKHLPRFRTDGVRNQLEFRVKREVEEVIGNIKEHKSEPILLAPYLSSSVSNVICSILMGIRFSPDEARFIRFMGLINEGFRLFTIAAGAAFIPILRFLPRVSWAFNQLIRNHEEILKFGQEVVEEHKVNLDYQEPPKDLVDAYIQEIRAMEDGHSDGRLFAGMNADTQIQQMIGDLFSAGTETIQTTLRWAVIFALREPDFQRRVQLELDTVIGPKRLTSLKDKSKLPFTEAFLLEVMRRATAVPLGTVHVASKDTTIKSMSIPKGTQVIPLIHAVHMDPKLWTHPEIFNPERFLSADGRRVMKPEYFIPFGVGRRSCPGDTLAMGELFLFFSSLLHRFEIRLPEGVIDPPKVEGVCGATFFPKPFLVQTIPRNIQ